MQLIQHKWPQCLPDQNTAKVILTLYQGTDSTTKSKSCLTGMIVSPSQDKITVIKRTLKTVKALHTLHSLSKTQ